MQFPAAQKFISGASSSSSAVPQLTQDRSGAKWQHRQSEGERQSSAKSGGGER